MSTNSLKGDFENYAIYRKFLFGEHFKYNRILIVFELQPDKKIFFFGMCNNYYENY